MSKELEYFQEIIKVDEEALTFANKEKNKKRDVMLHRQWLNKRKNIIESALRALEIIKEKQIDVLYITMFPDSLEKYNKHVSFIGKNKWCLNEEEFDLLREVLL